MRVAAIVPDLTRVGPVIVARIVATHLRAHGVQTKLVALRRIPPAGSQWLRKCGLAVAELGMPKLPGRRDYVRLQRELSEYRPDVAHAHGFWPVVMLARIPWAGRRVATIHDDPPTYYRITYGPLLASWMLARLGAAVRAFDVIACVSSRSAESIARRARLDTPRVQVVPNGVEDRYEAAYPEGRMAFPEGGTFRIVSFTTLSRLKNVDLAIRAVGTACRINPRIRYDVYGEGQERRRLELLARSHDLVGNVVVHHAIEHERVFTELASAHAALMLSRTEGLSLSALEAQMMGVPLVCSDIPEFRTVVSNGVNGYLVDPHDTAATGRVLASLAADHPAWQAMSRHARERYSASFRASETALRYLSIYRRD